MSQALTLVSIQHELAMSIGNDIRLTPMLRQFMKVCSSRLSLQGCHIYFFDLSGSGSRQLSHLISYPSVQVSSLQKSSFFQEWLTDFSKLRGEKDRVYNLRDSLQHYHVFPIADQGVVVCERKHTPLDADIISALIPVVRRLAVSCRASLEHERTLLEIKKRQNAEDALRRQLKFTEAIADITELIATEENSQVILQKSAAILGEVLALEHVVIFDVDFSADQAKILVEWMRPDTRGHIAETDYPLTQFRRTANQLHAQASITLVSDYDARDSLIVNDGFDRFLHEELGIRSLLWKSLHSHSHGFKMLSLNRFSKKKVWDEDEFDFLDAVIHHVSFALTKSALLKEREKSEEDLRLAACAFETNEAIFITDSEGNVQRVNQAFTRITGYTADEVVGRTASLLQSGRHDRAFYQDMWESLHKHGQWKGEIWNKRKNGEIYPQWQSITSTHNHRGEVTHYISTFQDITERKRAEARIRQMAFYDSLTILPNRTLLMDQLHRELAISIRRNTYSAVLFLDLDRFKTINDSLGHPAGDTLLQQVALRLKNTVREEDTVARLGGDEFVVLLPQLNQCADIATTDALIAAEKIRSVISEPYILLDHEYHVTPSIGIALLPENKSTTVDDVLKHADSAMYHAKAGGRNTIEVYHPNMQIAADERLRLEKDLRMVVERNELYLKYQPQYAANGNVIGVEALLRWQRPDGLVLPDEFIAVAEETGLILDIGEWVLKTAIEQVCSWKKMGVFPENASLAINVSPRQFHQKNFVSNIVDTVNVSAIEPSILKLEITEGIVMGNIENNIEKMHVLKNFGVSFSVDDFGTGYSSLAYLKRLPISQIKIDKSFVQDITCDPNDAAIVETIIAMAHHLSLDVIAEGVESQAELDFLKKRGCCKYQGYYFSPALSAREFERLIKKQACMVT